MALQGGLASSRSPEANSKDGTKINQQRMCRLNNQVINHNPTQQNLLLA
eukprot:CAMPEP_0174386646 /NCGR_PEP_ID=MMETSP0811_2-20130205/127414_1 /TAXON_ID=73025 ORGANISM="Eutreptiella gymnastica-like, Strain CCMP1594" /NCGR_SAMPLE_ID=MMETSP0811_2 /ASSEMBLY_ACC=CAM_ASM_000667 /LENGTH=48 /DNA_ID= /DNA_START= /DNA_END= /DNA_ORIENTATION=